MKTVGEPVTLSKLYNTFVSISKFIRLKYWGNHWSSSQRTGSEPKHCQKQQLSGLKPPHGRCYYFSSSLCLTLRHVGIVFFNQKLKVAKIKAALIQTLYHIYWLTFISHLFVWHWHRSEKWMTSRPDEQNLRSYRWPQQSLKSYRWARFYEFPGKKRRIYNFLAKYIVLSIEHIFYR